MRSALEHLDTLVGVQVEAASQLRRTAPVGPPQPAYVNAAARVITTLSPRALLAALAGLERAAGRRAARLRWAARPLDLDLLLFEGVVCAGPDLTLPHPELAWRPFVLEPLCDLDPALRHPILDRSMADLLQGVR